MEKPFLIKDSALAVISTGESATTLVHLKEVLKRIPLNSVYYHFWGTRLRPTFTHPDYHNDFAYWAHFSLHDYILSERFGIIDPTEYVELEDLRQTLIDIIDQRIDEVEYFMWSKDETKFYFLQATTIVFDTPNSLAHPSELKSQLPSMPLSSIFYHFIDARRRTQERVDDFTLWLKGFDSEYATLIEKIHLIDPYFLSLSNIRQRLVELVLDQDKK